ncbi:hypothetical protein [Dokdonella sp.]|uniref:hypothetical protein n=1 Tax=Dokdonella sp. TaxID=2291710 RepID=UPI0031C43884|nr:hypothetical protein [Dokdonella sp.]
MTEVLGAKKVMVQRDGQPIVRNTQRPGQAIVRQFLTRSLPWREQRAAHTPK